MALSLKQQSIDAFFRWFECKVTRLRELSSKSFEQEAFTLCLVYIDRLASGRYGGEPGKSRKSFWQALGDLSGNPLFAMIHPGELLKQIRAKCPFATSLIESIVNKQPHALLKEDELAGEIGNSSLTASEQTEVISNLWRASVANIAYDYIRNPEVHGAGSCGLSFDETLYEGKKGVRLDFDIFYDGLANIFKRVWEISVTTGEWFGNPDYMNHLPR